MTTTSWIMHFWYTGEQHKLCQLNTLESCRPGIKTMRTLKPVLEKTKIGAQGSFIKRQILPQVVPIKSWFLWDGSESGHYSFFSFYIFCSQGEETLRSSWGMWDELTFSHSPMKTGPKIFCLHIFMQNQILCALMYHLMAWRHTKNMLQRSYYL